MEWITVRGEDGRPTSYGWPDEESVGTGDCSCSTEAGEEEAEAAAKWKKEEEEEERTGHVWLPDLHEVLPCPAPSNNESRGQTKSHLPYVTAIFAATFSLDYGSRDQ